jgi:myo-inositol-1(or 4)-monophosphatase
VRPHDELLDIARHATAVGADIVKNALPTHVREKHDRDIVTDIDVQVERTIRAHLGEVTPEIGFLGEETGKFDPKGGYWWTLDPIDGTSNYAHGLPLCAVQLALIHEQRAVVSSITAPFLGLDYYAVDGGGAFCNDRQIHARPTTSLASAIVSIGDYATGPDAERKNERRLRLTQSLIENVERVRMFGSAALDLVWVAEGRTDAAIILANKVWDVEPGGLIVREAGALLLDGTGRPHTHASVETIAVTSRLVHALIPLIPAN